MKKNKNKPSWFLTLFSLPFAAVAVGMLGWAIIPSLYEYQQMQAWHPVNAKVISVNLETHYGDDSTTYHATGEYRYEYAGQDYYGTRLGISEGSDNIGDWHADTVRQLKYLQNKNRWVTVYVNPEDPSQSVYDRELRIGKLLFYGLFVVVFGIVGFGLLIFSFKHGSDDTGIIDSAQPWLAKKQWNSPEIIARQGAATWMLWGIAIIWCALSAPANLVIKEELAKGNWAILVILLFDIVGIALVLAAIRQTLASKKFGNTLLRLDPFPASINGQIGGMIETKVPFDANLAFNVKLSCIRTWVSGSGKNRSTHHDTLWQDERWFHAERGVKAQSDLWFCFDVPDNLPYSEEASNDYRHWQLHAEADIPGIDFDRQWEVPVFVSGKQTKKASSRCKESHEEHQQAISRLMNLQLQSGGFTLDYKAGRHWFAGVMLMLVGLVFAVIAWFVGNSANAFGEYVITTATGILGPGLFVLGFWMLCNRFQVSLDARELFIRYSIFGVPFYMKRIPRRELARLELKRGSRTQSGNDITQYYHIKMTTKYGKSYGIGDGFKGHSQASRAAEQLAKISKIEF